MNALPRPMVYTAALVLVGVAILGLYLGIHGSLERPYGGEETISSPTTPISEAAMRPGMAAAVEAKPMTSEVLPASAAPPAQQLAEAKPAKPRRSADDDGASDQAPAASNAPALQRTAPEPPPLYAPDEPPAAPPPDEANAPPY